MTSPHEQMERPLICMMVKGRYHIHFPLFSKKHCKITLERMWQEQKSRADHPTARKVKDEQAPQG